MVVRLTRCNKAEPSSVLQDVHLGHQCYCTVPRLLYYMRIEVKRFYILSLSYLHFTILESFDKKICNVGQEEQREMTRNIQT